MIRITDSAKAKMVDILNEGQEPFIRFGLHGGGCNGFQYFLSLEERQDVDDIELVLDDNYKLLVDPASMMYLLEAEIDYKRDIMGESFVFNNPNQTGHCGCGQSVNFD